MSLDPMDMHALIATTAARYGMKGRPRVIVTCVCGQVHDSGVMHEGCGADFKCHCGRTWTTTYTAPKRKRAKK